MLHVHDTKLGYGSQNVRPRAIHFFNNRAWLFYISPSNRFLSFTSPLPLPIHLFKHPRRTQRPPCVHNPMTDKGHAPRRTVSRRTRNVHPSFRRALEAMTLTAEPLRL